MTDLRFQHLERHRVRGTRDWMELCFAAPRSRSEKAFPYDAVAQMRGANAY